MPIAEARLDQVERDVRDHAKTISVIIDDQRFVRDQVAGLEQDKAVRAVEDKHNDERLDRIEESIKNVYSLGKWILATVGTALVGAIIDFVSRLGPHV